MRILFIGCVLSSYLFLEELIKSKKNVVAVITKENSTFNSDYCDLSMLCKNNQIDYKYTNSINDIENKEYIKGKNVDLILCLGWSQLLDEELLNLAKVACIGFHPAELPYNKGRHPLIWALTLGLKQTASTLFEMTAKADDGKILSQEIIQIDYLDDAKSLYNKVMEIAPRQLIDVVDSYEQGESIYLDVDYHQGNSWRKRGKEDGKIDWRMSSRNIYNLVRALSYPYVGAHFCYKNTEYKVWKVKEVLCDSYQNIEPGKVIRYFSHNHFVVKTGDNLIEILECDAINLFEGEYL